MARPKKVEPKDLTLPEHVKCAKDLFKAQKLIEKWNDRYTQTPLSKSSQKVLKQMHSCLVILSDKLCMLLDDEVCEMDEDEVLKYKKKYKVQFVDSPYYGNGKKVWE